METYYFRLVNRIFNMEECSLNLILVLEMTKLEWTKLI